MPWSWIGRGSGRGRGGRGCLCMCRGREEGGRGGMCVSLCVWKKERESERVKTKSEIEKIRNIGKLIKRRVWLTIMQVKTIYLFIFSSVLFYSILFCTIVIQSVLLHSNLINNVDLRWTDMNITGLHNCLNDFYSNSVKFYSILFKSYSFKHSVL